MLGIYLLGVAITISGSWMMKKTFHKPAMSWLPWLLVTGVGVLLCTFNKPILSLHIAFN